MDSKRRYRILWCFVHKTLRYEEVPALITAGFEVVPVTGDQIELFNKNNPGYDDPSHPLYVDWESSCTIPKQVLNAIRKIKILGPDYARSVLPVLSKKEKALINEWFDIIYVCAYPHFVQYYLNWFNGVVLYRVFGVVGNPLFKILKDFTGSKYSILAAKRKHVWLPILIALTEIEPREIIGDFHYPLPAFVSKSRLKYTWDPVVSQNICHTVIPYIDEAPNVPDYFLRKYYLSLKAAFKKYDITHKVYGKNNKRGPLCSKDNTVIGAIENDDEYYKQLVNCRVYVEPGQTNYHAHFAGIEALAMGIPTLYLKESGIGREIREVLTEHDLSELGMCMSLDKIAERVTVLMSDIEQAKNLSEKQRLISQEVFSKARFMRMLEQLKSDLPTIVAANQTGGFSIHRLRLGAKYLISKFIGKIGRYVSKGLLLIRRVFVKIIKAVKR